jgi:hypothetical protein
MLHHHHHLLLLLLLLLLVFAVSLHPWLLQALQLQAAVAQTQWQV